ncbi:MAG: CBS domain-containing protein [Polyangiaceae bacterium]|nr:CBS domain-containing protein [Polyangiaceae bacterium]
MKLPTLFKSGTRALTVGELMRTSVRTCCPDDTLNRAAQIMWENDCGCVPVVDASGRVVAVITDRDVCMAAYTQDHRLTQLRVSSAMSKALYCCAAYDSLATAEGVMQNKQVHRLPVTDRDGRLLGILTLGDLARHLDTHPAGATEVSPDEVAWTLAGICRPRTSCAERSPVSRRSRPPL